MRCVWACHLNAQTSVIWSSDVPKFRQRRLLLPDPADDGTVTRSRLLVGIDACQGMGITILAELIHAIGTHSFQIWGLRRAIHGLCAALLACGKRETDQEESKKLVHHPSSITGSYDECKPTIIMDHIETRRMALHQPVLRTSAFRCRKIMATKIVITITIGIG